MLIFNVISQAYAQQSASKFTQLNERLIIVNEDDGVLP